MKNYLKNRFLEFSLNEKLFDEGDKVLVTVSGGVDSVVLLHLLHAWRKRFKIELGVGHLHHHLRDEEADADQEFVRELARKLALSYHNLQHSVKEFAQKHKLSVEEAGHILREKLFEQLASREGYQKIATGHQLDDQAETVLMRILSGTGLQGLVGIRLKKDKWVRPLLFAKRCEIEEYAVSANLEYRFDSTNENLSILRNKIRHQLLPLLQQDYNPNVSKHLNQFSQILKEWDSYIQKAVEEVCESKVNKLSQNKIVVELSTFKLYFSWILCRLIEVILSYLTDDRVKISYNQYNSFIRWINQVHTGGRFQWQENIFSIKRKNHVLFFTEHYVEPDEHQIRVFEDKEYLIQEKSVCIKLTRVKCEEVQFSANRDVEYIDGAGLEFPLLIRNWRPGDRFIPFSGQHSKLVSDYLTDCKIALPGRKQVRVLVNKDEIVALLGIQISNDYRVHENSKSIYCIKITKYCNE